MVGHFGLAGEGEHHECLALAETVCPNQHLELRGRVLLLVSEHRARGCDEITGPIETENIEEISDRDHRVHEQLGVPDAQVSDQIGEVQCILEFEQFGDFVDQFRCWWRRGLSEILELQPGAQHPDPHQRARRAAGQGAQRQFQTNRFVVVILEDFIEQFAVESIERRNIEHGPEWEKVRQKLEKIAGHFGFRQPVGEHPAFHQRVEGDEYALIGDVDLGAQWQLIAEPDLIEFIISERVAIVGQPVDELTLSHRTLGAEDRHE